MNWMRNFSIRLRMQGAIVAVLALFSLVGLTAVLGGRHMAELNDSFMAHSVKEVHNVGAIRTALGEVRQSEKNMVIDYEDGVAVLKHQEHWKGQLIRTREALSQLLEGEEDEDNPLARQALKEIDQYQAATLRVLEQIQNGAFDNARAADRMLGRAKEHVEAVHQLTNRIESIVDAEATATQGEFHAEMTRTAWWFGGMLGLVILIVVPLTLVNSSSITQPVLGARDLAVAIAEGQLDQRIDTRGQDEAAELMRALARMQQTLGQLVGGVRRASENIQVASSEVASGNTDLSQRTEQTASNLEQTASSMEQLTANVRQSADAARHASELAESASSVATRGGQAVAQVVHTMDEITTASRRIGDIIGVIDGIAFQTNILALNAAVEAARAGEQGRGFAVVASEVRSLAGRSAEAAREIKSLIQASVEKVEHGTGQVRQAGATMDEIVSSVQRVTDIIREISAAAAEQSQGIGQVNSAVSHLDQMTQQNAALVEQSAAAAESLKDQAGQLNGMVAHFQVEGLDVATPAFAPVRSAQPAPAALQPVSPALPAARAGAATAPPAATAPAAPRAEADTDWETF